MNINLEKPPISSTAPKKTNSSAILIASVIAVALGIGGYLYQSSNNGILDSDNDGIADTVDRCPTEKGPLDMAGCPTGSIATNTSVEGQNETATTAQPVPQASKIPTSAPIQKNTSEVESSNQSKQLINPENQSKISMDNASKGANQEAISTEQIVKNVSARIKTNPAQNNISWNQELSKAKDLQLSINSASGLNFKKDVTGLGSFIFNPGSGEWQGKKCTVSLTSSDPKIIIDNSKLPNTFFNCSAE